MNRKMVYFLLGRILLLEAALMALPLGVSLYYWDGGQLPFLITIALSLSIGWLLCKFFRTDNQVIYAKEGFYVTALVWVTVSAPGGPALRALRGHSQLHRRLL